MATLSSFLRMVGTTALFDPVAGASAEANDEAIHALTGIDKVGQGAELQCIALEWGGVG
jgi:hypothetical protein